MIFVDGCCNDISTARAAIVQEEETQCTTRHDTANDQRHEVLSFAQYFHHVALFVYGHGLTHHLQQDSKNNDGVDGFHQKFPSQYFQADNQQHPIHHEIGV